MAPPRRFLLSLPCPLSPVPCPLPFFPYAVPVRVKIWSTSA